MKKHVVRVAGLALCLCLLAACSVFPNSRKINDYCLISAVGVDPGEKDKDNIAITLSTKVADAQLSGGKGSAGQGGDKPLTLTNEAGSISIALAEVQTYTQDYVFLGHAQYYIMGESAARQNVSHYLDFVCRDPDMRLQASLIVVKDATARDAMTKASTNQNFISDRLASMQQQVGIMSLTHIENVAQVVNALNTSRGNTLLPLIQIVDTKAHDASAEPDNPEEKEPQKGPSSKPKDIDLGGYAIIIDGKMTETIGLDYARGVNYLQNNAKNCMLEVQGSDGEIVTLRLLKSTCTLKAHWKEDAIEWLEVDVSFTSSINETLSRDNYMTLDDVDPLRAQQDEYIREQIEAVIQQAQRLGADYLGLGARLSRRHPVRFSRLEQNWDKVFATLPIHVNVDSAIRRTYDINRPNFQPESEK